MTEWGLECEPGEYVALFSEMFFIGFVIGGFLGPAIIAAIGIKKLVVVRSLLIGAIFAAMVLIPKSPGVYWS